MTKTSTRHPDGAPNPPDAAKEETRRRAATRQCEMDSKSRKIHASTLGLLIVLFSMFNLNWIFRDKGVLEWDGYYYLIKLLRFIDNFDTVTFSNLEAPLRQLSLDGRPPLYQIITIPFILLFGRSEDAALSVNLVFIAILLISVYNIGKISGNSKVGLLAALLVGTYPTVVQLSRMYLPQFAIVACCALSTWLLILLVARPSVKYALYFTASLAFGLLTHPHFSDALIVPTVIFGIYLVFIRANPRSPCNLKNSKYWLWKKLQAPFVLYGLIPGSLVFVGIALAWYAFFGSDLLAKNLDLHSSTTADISGSSRFTCGFRGINADFWWYGVTAPGAISIIFALLVVCGLVWSFLRPRLATSILAVTLLGGYIIKYIVTVALCWIYFAPFLPAAAVLSAVFVVGIRPRWLSILLSSLSIIVAVFNYSIVTWGVQPWSRSVATALGAPLNSACRDPGVLALCPEPPRPEALLGHRILEPILSDPDCQTGQPCRIMAESRFVTQIQYLNAREKRAGFWISNFGNRQYGQPFRLEALLRSDYIFYITTQAGPQKDNYGVAWARFLQSPPLVFAAAHQTVASYENGDGRSARLVKRIKDLTVEEAISSIAALELAEKYKSERSLVLARVYLAEGDLDEAVENYEEAVRESLDSRFPAAFLLRIANIYRDRGDVDKSIGIYRELLRRDSKNIAALTGLAVAYLANDRNEEAVRLYEEILSVNPNQSQARLALDKLKGE